MDPRPRHGVVLAPARQGVEDQLHTRLPGMVPLGLLAVPPLFRVEGLWTVDDKSTEGGALAGMARTSGGRHRRPNMCEQVCTGGAGGPQTAVPGTGRESAGGGCQNGCRRIPSVPDASFWGGGIRGT